MSVRHLSIFEPHAGGHHGLFVQHLVQYWGDSDLAGTLELIVTPQFMETHQKVGRLIESYPHSDIRIRLVDPLPRLTRGTLVELVQHDLRQGRLLQSLIEESRPSHVLLMYFDHLQLSLASGLRMDPPVHIAGIYFRPSFHYPIQATARQPAAHRLKQWRKRIQLRTALRNPSLRTLFCLDPYVVPLVQRMSGTRAIALPDGVEHAQEDASRTPLPWSIEEGRFTALCFGSLARRKGVFNILNALTHLTPEIQNRLAVVFAGSLVEHERQAFQELVSYIRDHTDVQLIVDDRFVHDDEVHSMMECADLVLVAYQHHIGSSNVLIRAAHAEVPVLGSDYGLMGAQIIEHSLGTAVDTTNPAVIARDLTAHLISPAPPGFDRNKARAFAAANSAHQYAHTIFSSLEFV